MIYEVEVSEQADSDLRGIFEYIAFELQSPENKRTVEKSWTSCITSRQLCGTLYSR